MAHGLHAMIKSEIGCSSSGKPRPGGGSSASGGAAGKMGSRRIFTPQFKLQVLDSYRNDSDCKGNQRATARKYGIHRRQIQKWLQVENNLRSAAANSANGGGGAGSVPTGAAAPPSFSHPHETSSSSASLSVLNGKSAAAVALAASQQVPRPTFSPVSGGEYPDRLHLLDQYYHYARYAIDCPIDLSLPQQFRKVEQQALSPCSTASSVYSSRPRSATPPVQDQAQENAAVDLSCRKRKSSEDSSSDGASAPKSVKLFKPYLLDEKEEDKEDKDSQIDSPLPKEVGRHDYPPIIWNFHAQQRYYEGLYGSEYGSGTPYGYPPSPLYPVTPIPRTPFSTLSPSPPSSSWAPPQASPVSGYDSSTSISSVYSHDGNEDTAGYSYSLELKQQAIDSYYHDVSCRGDFRAVASKFNIQRKYVEKWLAQEDHLGAGNSQPPPPPLPQVVVG
ncbi:conserved hypothetical protein [Culex quinquefasciatus]|uniref:Brinker DNA-binding domain-containing protein n=1 Tax=Culex quinquefasciatus TaxID=7176 RepID=B0WF59_CULQU|nr:conserved hypothetical protein [Culex quinquefasciatus]|eukprot:XP_001847343.1 conserved hypothetical protein [Culex quinquefasciatus]